MLQLIGNESGLEETQVNVTEIKFEFAGIQTPPELNTLWKAKQGAFILLEIFW